MLNTQQPTLAANESTEKSAANGKLALLAICTGYFMVILDATIVTVALPNIQSQLGAGVTGLQWVVDGYSLAFASLLLTAGVLGDRLGNRRVFLIGLLLFIVTSALCGIANALWLLIAARVLQGIGAATLVPSSLALLSQRFPDTRERARAIGIWGSVAGIGAASGPVIGGLLVNMLSWRAIFLVNIPVGVLGFLLTRLYISPQCQQTRRSLDSVAQLVSIIALGALTFAIIEREGLGWPLTLALLLVALLAIGMFVLIEQRVKQPMLPLALFSSTKFSASNTVGLLLNLGFYGQLFVVSLFFQQILDFSPLLTGLALLPESVLVFLASPLSGRAAGRFGVRVPMVCGLATGCAGFAFMALVTATTPYVLIAIMLAAMGFGTAFTMPAMTAAVMESSPRERAGTASGVLNASRQIGGTLGVAILGTLVGQHSTFVNGMHYAMLISATAFLIGCLLSFFLVRGK